MRGTASGDVALVADLDTGSHVTVLDAAIAGAETSTWLAGRHLGEAFFWSPASVDVELRTTGGTPLRRHLAIWQVRDWAGSPFVRINPARQVLAGRDLLRAFGLSVVLRAAEAETEVVAGR